MKGLVIAGITLALRFKIAIGFHFMWSLPNVNLIYTENIFKDFTMLELYFQVFCKTISFLQIAEQCNCLTELYGQDAFLIASTDTKIPK